MKAKQKEREEARKRRMEEAREAYTEEHILASGALQDIKDLLESLPAPANDTNWGNVGDIQAIRQELEATRQRLENISIGKAKR